MNNFPVIAFYNKLIDKIDAANDITEMKKIFNALGYQSFDANVSLSADHTFSFLKTKISPFVTSLTFDHKSDISNKPTAIQEFKIDVEAMTENNFIFIKKGILRKVRRRKGEIEDRHNKVVKINTKALAADLASMEINHKELFLYLKNILHGDLENIKAQLAELEPNAPQIPVVENTNFPSDISFSIQALCEKLKIQLTSQKIIELSNFNLEKLIDYNYFIKYKKINNTDIPKLIKLKEKLIILHKPVEEILKKINITDKISPPSKKILEGELNPSKLYCHRINRLLSNIEGLLMTNPINFTVKPESFFYRLWKNLFSKTEEIPEIITDCATLKRSC